MLLNIIKCWLYLLFLNDYSASAMNTEWKYAKFNQLREALTEKSQFMFFETLILGYSKNNLFYFFFRKNHVGLKNTWGIKVVFWQALSAFIFLFWVYTTLIFTSILESGQYFSPFRALGEFFFPRHSGPKSRKAGQKSKNEIKNLKVSRMYYCKGAYSTSYSAWKLK